ncbi:MAG TPA: M28 family metallopeptidase [Candidatus Koribacter sp.]
MKTFVLAMLIGSSVVGVAQSAANSYKFDGKQWWHYVNVLADDKMDGRLTGSEGEKAAKAFLVEQAKADGLKPAGTDGFYQPVALLESRVDESHSYFELVNDGKPERLTLGDDVILGGRTDGGEVEAALVFVGYGLKIPEKNYDDLAGQDLKGKVAVMFSGSPAEMPTELASHYQSGAERWKALKAAGVVGVIALPNMASMDIPWARIKGNRLQPSMRLADLNETEGEKVGAFMNPASAEKLFAGSGHTFAEIAALGAKRRALPHFALKVSLKANTAIERNNVESSNVVAKLEGADPNLKDEYVVLSAHIDHLGEGEAVNGDKIFNGAMDNGAGSSMLLDLARSLKEHPEKLKRSLLFVWVTGEEKGLLGSRYFALHPTVPAQEMVADINTDMFLPIIPMKVITAYGLKESDLGDDLEAAAKQWGIPVQPDPQPLRNIFIRSDQYSFVRVGVPAIMFDIGADKDSADRKVLDQWLKERYHNLTDDTKQPVNLETAAKYEDVFRTLTVDVADGNKKPEWKADSFFKRFAAGGGQ